MFKKEISDSMFLSKYSLTLHKENVKPNCCSTYGDDTWLEMPKLKKVKLFCKEGELKVEKTKGKLINNCLNTTCSFEVLSHN